MKNISFFLYLLLIIIILDSCATLKKDKLVEGQIEITDKNLYLLNGKYSRVSIGDDSSDLFWGVDNKGYNIGDMNLCSVDLKVIDKRHIKAILFKNNSILKSRILRGKLKNGYFELRRRYLIVPAIFLNVFRTIKFRIGILKNGNLTTDHKEILFGTYYLIFPGYQKDYEPNVEYKRLY